MLEARTETRQQSACAASLSVGPGHANEFYKTDEEFVYALAEALRVEYKGIAQAGFQVQVDDARLG